jgi:hypothetical protein
LIETNSLGTTQLEIIRLLLLLRPPNGTAEIGTTTMGMWPLQQMGMGPHLEISTEPADWEKAKTSKITCKQKSTLHSISLPHHNRTVDHIFSKLLQFKKPRNGLSPLSNQKIHTHCQLLFCHQTC